MQRIKMQISTLKFVTALREFAETPILNLILILKWNI
jgi:hypothetical protein